MVNISLLSQLDTIVGDRRVLAYRKFLMETWIGDRLLTLILVYLTQLRTALVYSVPDNLSVSELPEPKHFAVTNIIHMRCRRAKRLAGQTMATCIAADNDDCFPRI